MRRRVVDISEEAFVRDVSDRTILRAARQAKVDVLITGDKNFLESIVTKKHDRRRIVGDQKFKCPHTVIRGIPY